jgi:transaldolase
MMSSSRTPAETPSRETSTPSEPTAQLRENGQAIWLDFIERHLIVSGGLERLVAQEGVSGVTSNPTIFEKAIDGSNDYGDEIDRISRRTPGVTPRHVFEQLAVRDIRDAADILRRVYDATDGRDGFASIEVAPDLAHDTVGTVDEAHRLYAEVGRPNVMVKVPGTVEGLPAIRQLLIDGIPTNITLLFARDRYEAVACTYLDALEARLAVRQPIDKVASVASFFVSRIDTAVDALLTKKVQAAPESKRHDLELLFGAAAIANAKLAYAMFESMFSGTRWQALQANGARVQRVLWASTSVKDPRYRDTRYVEELIGANTVNTMPLDTLAAFREHGRVRQTVGEGVEDASRTLVSLEKQGISLQEVTDGLLREGVEKFVQAYNKVVWTVERRLKPGA